MSLLWGLFSSFLPSTIPPLLSCKSISKQWMNGHSVDMQLLITIYLLFIHFIINKIFLSNLAWHFLTVLLLLWGLICSNSPVILITWLVCNNYEISNICLKYAKQQTFHSTHWQMRMLRWSQLRHRRSQYLDQIPCYMWDNNHQEMELKLNNTRQYSSQLY